MLSKAWEERGSLYFDLFCSHTRGFSYIATGKIHSLGAGSFRIEFWKCRFHDFFNVSGEVIFKKEGDLGCQKNPQLAELSLGAA